MISESKHKETFCEDKNEKCCYTICIGCGDVVCGEDVVNFPRFCSILYPCQLLRLAILSVKIDSRHCDVIFVRYLLSHLKHTRHLGLC